MAYDAGSVIFKFEADTTNIDKALSDIKNAQNTLKSGSNRNTYLSDAVRDWNRQTSAIRQTIRMQTQQNQLSQAGYSINAQGMASFLSNQQQLKNMLGSTMGNTATQLGTITGTLSKFTPAIGAIGVGIKVVKAGIEGTKKAAQKTLKYAAAAVVEIKVISSAVKTLISTLTTLVTKSGEFVYKISGLEGTVNALKSAFSSLKDTITEAFSIDNIEDFIEECVELGSSLTEIQNVVDKVFTDNSSTIDEWASSSISSLGMAENTTKKYAATYASMLEIAGVSSDNLVTMSESLTNLTADIASFRDEDFDTVFEKIKSGLSGQVRPLKEYGISMEAANIQQWMNEQGIEATYTQLDYASKELIRYNYLLDQTTVLQGDWTDTIYTWSNQIKVMKEYLTEIKTALGQIFVAFLRPLLIFANKMLDVITSKIKSLYEYLSTAFPLLFDQLSEATDSTDYSNVLEDMEESADDATDAIKRTVSSFDELHKLNDDSSSSSTDLSDLDITTYTTDAETAVNTLTTKIGQLVEQLINQIKKSFSSDYDLTWLGALVGEQINKIVDYIYEKMDAVKEKLVGYAKAAATFINGLLYEVDWKKLGETISKILTTIQSTILSFIEELDWSAVGHAFAESIKGIFNFNDEDGENIITKGFNIVKSTINGFSDSVSTFLKDMSTIKDDGFLETEEGMKYAVSEWKTYGNSFVDEWTYIGNQIANGVNSLFDEDSGIKWENIGKNINGLITGILRLINTAVLNIKWDEIGESLGKMFASLFAEDENGNTILGKLGTTINNFINGLITMIKTTLETPGVIDGMKNNITQLFDNIEINWEDVQFIFDTVYDLVKEFWTKLKSKIDWKVVITEAIKILSDLVKEGITTLLTVTLVAAAAFLVGVIKWIWSAIKTIASLFSEGASQLGSELQADILNLVDIGAKIETWLGTKLQAFGDWIVEGIATDINDYILPFFKDMFSTIKTDLSSLITTIKEKLTAVKTWISEKLTGFKTSLFNVLSAIKTKLTSAWSWLKTNIFDKISSGVKTMLNAVISTINSLISKLNSISFTMPDWLGGGTFGLSIPTLPLLAEGGYIGANMPTPVVVGDNKTEGEIVAPESKIQENVAIALEPYMSKIESLLTALINSEDEIHVHLEMDGDEITEVVLNNAKLATARGGA